jgi:hypothetical protein
MLEGHSDILTPDTFSSCSDVSSFLLDDQQISVSAASKASDLGITSSSAASPFLHSDDRQISISAHSAPNSSTASSNIKHFSPCPNNEELVATWTPINRYDDEKAQNTTFRYAEAASDRKIAAVTTEDIEKREDILASDNPFV